MAKQYVLEHDYLSADARLYKRGDKITLEADAPAVKLCAPLGTESLPDVEPAPVADVVEEEDETPKKKAPRKGKKDEPSIFD
jgi:hypothetical protein